MRSTLKGLLLGMHRMALPRAPTSIRRASTRLRVPRRDFATHRSRSACSAQIVGRSQDLSCACAMLSSSATRKHLQTELFPRSSKLLRLTCQFASSPREVLPTRTKSLRSATRCLRGAESSLRGSWKPFIAPRIDFRGRRIRSGRTCAWTG